MFMSRYNLKNRDIIKLSEQALKTSMKNERALWQKFQAEKSFDELASEIANME